MTKLTMNDQIKRVALVGLALFVILMINVNWIQGSQAEKWQKNPLNTRQYQDVLLRARGDILSADKVRLAYSEPLNPGNSKTKYQRHYLQNGEVFTPVTGFFAGTQQKSGLEIAYDSLLDGRDQRQTANSWIKELAGEKALGANVYTTIDSKAQITAYQQLTAQSPHRAAAVVLDLKTGAIKVAASYPSFDPNSIADIKNPGDAQKKLNELDSEPTKPLVNKAYGDLFPPGSSFKTVVASAFLAKGNTKDTLVPAPQFVQTGGKPIGNSHTDAICGAAQAPLIGTFAESCNTTYALLGADDNLLGNEAVRAQAEKYGFYHKIQIETDLSAPASLYPHGVSDRAEILRGSFGQGETKATPLQMAMIGATVGNNGTMMKPYLVQKVVARVSSDKGKPEEAGTLYEATEHTMGKPISSEVAANLQDMMKEVVRSGTAKNLAGRDIAGKTGTTELDGRNGGAWFVGYAPASNPKWGFAVFVEGSTSIFGASTAGPIAAAIVDTLSRG